MVSPSDHDCPASLDNFNLTALSRPVSPSFTSVSKAGRARRYVPSPLSGKYSENTNAPSRTISRASSFSGSIMVSGRESRASVALNSGNHTSFTPLPPISSDSSDIRTFLDFTFQSFSLSTAPSIHLNVQSLSSPTLPPLPTLSQPLFSPPSPKPRPVLHVTSLCHPNSPYVPWDSPVRREIFRPLTPDSFASDFSRYSRPFSRSGARAPEPTEIPEAVNGRPRVKMLKVSQSVRNIRRSVKRNVAKCFSHLSLARSKPHDGPAGPSSPTHADDHILLYSPPPSPTMSIDTSNTRSISLWLESCRQDRSLHDVHCMSLEDYERMGSWTDLPEGFVCNLAGCQFHSHRPDTPNSGRFSRCYEPISPYSGDEPTSTNALSTSFHSRSYSTPDVSLQTAGTRQ
ncbi:hypothetical protein D9758_002430 [Tetrapyrgos nigripes]|uniref:Uncharacterized protein n=1 Tax=Tetrapyrgos nigripes TaxID=182062 RepID=A0A8H5LT55_9AGAR|nr:hypothetical protein D9758_002430 [Tetrapyrgos nigripes]